MGGRKKKYPAKQTGNDGIDVISSRPAHHSESTHRDTSSSQNITRESEKRESNQHSGTDTAIKAHSEDSINSKKRDLSIQISDTDAAWKKPCDAYYVAALEDKIVENIASNASTSHSWSQSHGLVPVERPDYGLKKDRIVDLWGNYFELCLDTNKDYYQYRITVTEIKVEPKIDNPKAASVVGLTSSASKQPISDRPLAEPLKGRKLNRMIKLWLETRFVTDSIPDAVSDFSQTLITCTEIGTDLLNKLNAGKPVSYREEREDAGPHSRKYRIQIEEVELQRPLKVEELVQYLSSPSTEASYDAKASMIQALDIILGFSRKSSAEKVSLGRGQCFDVVGLELDDKQELPRGLIARRGFFSSARLATPRVLLNVNVCHGAFVNTDATNDLTYLYDEWRIIRTSSAYETDEFEKFIKGLRVEITHMKPRTNNKGESVPRIKTICELAHRQSQGQQVGAGPHDIHFKLGASRVSVMEYWRDKGYPRIERVDLPLINVGSKEKPTYLPPQACKILSGQVRRNLSPEQTREMIKFAAGRLPGKNQRSIAEKSFELLGLGFKDKMTKQFTENNILSRFGIALLPDMISVLGRVLPPPTLRYNPKSNSPKVTNGQWNLSGVVLKEAGSLGHWSIVRLRKKVSSNIDVEKSQVNLFLQTMRRTFGSNASVSHPDNQPWEVIINNANDSKLDDLFAVCTHKRINFLLVILPSDDSVLYNRVKVLGDIIYGINTVCAVGVENKFSRKVHDRFANSARAYYANIALKVNLKLKGSNHVLDSKDLGIISDGKTMIIGIDVTHPDPGSSAPSVAAMVASVDEELAQWPVDLRINKSRQEMIECLALMLDTRLELWKKEHHGNLPENILIYRDGVSEGQYQAVLEHELPKLRAGFNGRIALVVVGKRHHTRFYKKNASNDETNPESGTIVDRGIMEARNWEFFLQSHHAAKGTARPAHYFVLVNEIFTKDLAQEYGYHTAADMLEGVTYNMCWLYGRATSAVSIPPPVYYADLACKRGRRYLPRPGTRTGSGKENKPPVVAGPMTKVEGKKPKGKEEPEGKEEPKGKELPLGNPKPMTKAEGKKPEAREAVPIGQEGVLIHPNLRETMFYI